MKHCADAAQILPPSPLLTKVSPWLTAAVINSANKIDQSSANVQQYMKNIEVLHENCLNKQTRKPVVDVLKTSKPTQSIAFKRVVVESQYLSEEDTESLEGEFQHPQMS